MRCEIEEESGFSVVRLSEEVDLSTSPRAREAILDRLSAGRSVMVDLAGVTYIDSSGVASLVEGYQTARTKGLRFGLLGVSEAVMNVLELARLDRIFPIFASLAECLDEDG